MKLYYRIWHKYSTEKAQTTMLLKWFHNILNRTGVGMGDNSYSSHGKERWNKAELPQRHEVYILPGT
jgi:hypothetical protein